MASLSDIVSVAIVVGTNAIQSTSFSSMMVLHTGAPAGAARVFSVTSTGDLVAQSGVATTDPLYLAVADAFGQSPAVNQVIIGSAYASDTTTGAALDAINAAASGIGGFYGFVVADRTIATIQSCMTWTQANGKLFGFSTAEPDAVNPITTDDLLSFNKSSQFSRSYGFYHASALTDYPDAAVMSRCFTAVPGSENWATRQLLGVSTDPLTEGARQAVFGKNGNTFEAVANTAITFNGTVGTGERIDVIRFIDWLQNEIQVDVANVMIGPNKVPYTEKGISTIKAGVVQALDQGVVNGGISPSQVNSANTVVPSYTVTMPVRANIPASDVAARQLNGIQFIAQLAGAINSAAIAGTVTYGNIS